MHRPMPHRRGRLTACLLVAVCLAVSAGAAARLYAREAQPAMQAVSMDRDRNPNLGKKFPAVRAETLEGRKTFVPDDAAGRVTLVAVAFLRENQPQLDSWLNPFYEKFGSREDIMFYEVPMIAGGYRFMKMIIDGGMRGGLPEFKHKHVVTMYGDVASYQRELDLDPRSGHAFLLDRQGRIRWQAEGFSTPEKLSGLFEATQALLDR